MSSPPEQLDAVLKSVWEALARGAMHPGSPFRTTVLATGAQREPRLRTVVLRHFEREARLLACHTDCRSTKVEEIARTPRVQWLFWDAERRIQLRASGQAVVSTEGHLVDNVWERAPAGARLGYLTEAPPGTRSEARWTGLPATLCERDPTEKESERGRENFALIACQVDELDWLQLGRYGHARAQFRWEDGRLDASWVVP